MLTVLAIKGSGHHLLVAHNLRVEDVLILEVMIVFHGVRRHLGAGVCVAAEMGNVMDAD